MGNARVVKISKLVNSVDIGFKEYNSTKVSIKKYDLFEVAIDSDNSEAFFNEYKPPADIALRPGGAAVPDTNFAYQIRSDNDGISKLYTPCIGSKSTQVVKRDKSMIPTRDKPEEIHADL